MPTKKFTVVFKSGDLLTVHAVHAATDDQNDGEGYVLFRDENSVGDFDAQYQGNGNIERLSVDVLAQRFTLK